MGFSSCSTGYGRMRDGRKGGKEPPNGLCDDCQIGVDQISGVASNDASCHKSPSRPSSWTVMFPLLPLCSALGIPPSSAFAARLSLARYHSYSLHISHPSHPILCNYCDDRSRDRGQTSPISFIPLRQIRSSEFGLFGGNPIQLQSHFPFFSPFPIYSLDSEGTNERANFLRLRSGVGE